MKNKGFTLIELLAVIVILTIIALIATPIILNIINDARDESENRSIELYKKAVENAVANYMMKNNGDLPTEDWIKENVESYYDGNKVECTIAFDEKGNVIVSGCSINSGTTVAKVCTLSDTDGNGSADVGEMVTCGSGDTAQSFYVMPDHDNATDGTISMMAQYNLISTINSPVQNVTNTIEPVVFSDSNYWGNVTDITFVYSDDASISEYVNAYKETLKEIGLSENIVATLPSMNQLTDSRIGCSYDDLSGTCTSASEWVYLTSYWTGCVNAYNLVINVYSSGSFGGQYPSGNQFAGVRPVIIIPEDEITI